VLAGLSISLGINNSGADQMVISDGINWRVKLGLLQKYFSQLRNNLSRSHKRSFSQISIAQHCWLHQMSTTVTYT
jgi:hypothetical protein